MLGVGAPARRQELTVRGPRRPTIRGPRSRSSASEPPRGVQPAGRPSGPGGPSRVGRRCAGGRGGGGRGARRRVAARRRRRQRRELSPRSATTKIAIDLDKPLTTSTTARRPTTTTTHDRAGWSAAGRARRGRSVGLLASMDPDRPRPRVRCTRIALPPASLLGSAAVDGSGRVGGAVRQRRDLLRPGARVGGGPQRTWCSAPATVPSGRGPDQVWLIAESGGGRPGCAAPRSDVRLVDLDGQVLRQFQVHGWLI